MLSFEPTFRAVHCLCGSLPVSDCVSLHIDCWMPEQVSMKLGMYIMTLQPFWESYFINPPHQSTCTVLGNGSVKTSRQRIHTHQQKDVSTLSFICGLCHIKGKQATGSLHDFFSWFWWKYSVFGEVGTGNIRAPMDRDVWLPTIHVSVVWGVRFWCGLHCRFQVNGFWGQSTRFGLNVRSFETRNSICRVSSS